MKDKYKQKKPCYNIYLDPCQVELGSCVKVEVAFLGSPDHFALRPQKRGGLLGTGTGGVGWGEGTKE